MILQDYWQEIFLLIFFVIALRQHGNIAFKDGLKDGADITLDMLEKERIISINDEGEITGVCVEKD